MSIFRNFRSDAFEQMHVKKFEDETKKTLENSRFFARRHREKNRFLLFLLKNLFWKFFVRDIGIPSKIIHISCSVFELLSNDIIFFVPRRNRKSLRDWYSFFSVPKSCFGLMEEPPEMWYSSFELILYPSIGISETRNR